MLSLVEAVTRINSDVAKSIPQELVTRLSAELMLRRSGSSLSTGGHDVVDIIARVAC